jgi:hypothetical protein
MTSFISGGIQGTSFKASRSSVSSNTTGCTQRTRGSVLHDGKRAQLDDIHAAVAELKSNSVVFEDYDLPGADNIATIEAEGRLISAAWFEESEGNNLAVGTS